MPLRLEASCRCGAVAFAVDSSAPCPYQLCYCSICRKTAGGGGFAINLLADARTLDVTGETAIYHAEIADGETCRRSEAERHFCPKCATALWLWDPNWPDLVHPFASAVDTDLPQPPARTHLLLRFKANWVEPQIGPNDKAFDDYPDESLEDWHRRHGLWID